MASTATKWLLGCGAGCLVILVLVAAVLAGSFFKVKEIVNRFEETEAIKETVAREYGDIDDFVPDPDGAIRPERLEAFLRVRELAAPSRAETERVLELLGDAETGEGSWSPGRVFKLFGAGAGLPTDIADFYTGRSEAMLEAEMGLGEYYYIYVLAYFAYLGKSPADGPPFRLVGGDEHDDGWDETDVREQRLEHVLRRVSRQLLPMLRRQLDAIGDGESADDSFRAALAGEVHALENGPLRLPWAEGLPEPIEASLHPYRDRLEVLYSAPCNPLEVHQH